MGEAYSSAERMVARLLSATPRLKGLVKKAYQYANWVVHRKSDAFQCALPITAIGDNSKEFFFGYYDKSPASPDGGLLLYQASSSPTHCPPNPESPVNIIVAEAATGCVVRSFSSSAYNWQQGTKLQWIGKDRFVFNDYDKENNRYVAHICDAKQAAAVRTLPMPVYDCFGESFALALSFDRLARLAPDYGYFCRKNRAFDLDDGDNDGVWHVNMTTGESRLVLSLSRLARLRPLSSMEGAQHSVNHIMIAPDGTRFMVIHRWYQAGRRYDRLVVAGVDGTDPVVVADEGMVSHCFWRDSNQIFGYLRHGGKDAYYMLDVDSGDAVPVGQGVIDVYGDGHPHIHGSKVVFDTYPNKARMQKLLLYDLEEGGLKELGEFYESFKFYGETRCDLHPRFSPDGKQVYFDSVHEGKRKLYRMDFPS